MFNCVFKTSQLIRILKKFLLKFCRRFFFPASLAHPVLFRSLFWYLSLQAALIFFSRICITVANINIPLRSYCSKLLKMTYQQKKGREVPSLSFIWLKNFCPNSDSKLLARLAKKGNCSELHILKVSQNVIMQRFPQASTMVAPTGHVSNNQQLPFQL